MSESIKNFLLETYMVCLPIVLGYIVWLLKRNKDKELKELERIEEERKKQDEKEANSIKGTTMVLRYIMKQYHVDYLMQNYITSEQLKDYNEIFDVYKSLGGNSVAIRWHEEINDLPIREK